MRRITNQSNIFSLQHDAPDRSAHLLARVGLFRRNFLRLIQYAVHELVETNYPPLDPQRLVLIEPDLHSRLGLEEFVDHENVPDHQLAQLLRLIFLHFDK